MARKTQAPRSAARTVKAAKPATKPAPVARKAAGPTVKPEAASDTDLLRVVAELLATNDLTEIELQKGDLRIRAARAPAPVHTPTIALPAGYAAGPFHAAPPVAPAAKTPATIAAESQADHPDSVKSPMVGTAYLRPNPDARQFIDLGSRVAVGDKLLLIEAMKTFNDIVAPRAGVVTAILVEDGQPVEYGQPLLVIE
jgi:acetyl-CoA carboxylase biotin carboxyl carrier protein